MLQTNLLYLTYEKNTSSVLENRAKVQKKSHNYKTWDKSLPIL